MFLTPFILQGVQLNWTGLVHNQECIVGARVVVHRLIKGMLRLVYLRNLKNENSQETIQIYVSLIHTMF